MSVSTIDRQHEIQQWVIKNKRVRLETLAEHFNYSLRTLQRDIKKLIEKNAPIFLNDGWVMLDEHKNKTYELGNMWFTQHELQSLLSLNHLLKSLNSTSLNSQLEPFQQRMNELLNIDSSAVNWSDRVKLLNTASRDFDDDSFSKVNQALLEQRMFSAQFYSRSTDETSSRQLTPIHLVRYRDNWYVDAWCHTRNAARTFALENLHHIKLLEKIEKPLPYDEVNASLQASYGIFAGNADKKAVLIFNNTRARWIKDEIWHSEQEAQWLDDGRYQLTIPYHNDTELLQDILRQGAAVEVISPEPLRQRVINEINLMKAIYND